MKEITTEQIEQLKAKYGELFKLTVCDKSCILKKPDRKILSAIGSFANNGIKVAEFMLNNCWVEGDEEIKKDDSYFLGAAAQLGNLIEIKQAEIVKL